MQMLIGPTVVILDMQHLQSITEGSQFFPLLKSLHVRVACIPADPYTRRIKGKESTSSQSSAASELTHWGHPRLFPMASGTFSRHTPVLYLSAVLTSGSKNS